ncbi:E3 ubiquitin-protein ligase ptr1 [Schizosaccharomyces pombe]
MRITKSPPKNQYSQPPPRVAEFIRQAQNEEVTSDLGLVSLCSEFRKNDWPYPRGDLYSWVPVLNRFDAILERIVEHYSLKDKVQTKPFDSDTLSILLEILSFSAHLLSHCANRSIYNSTVYLEYLLNSSVLEVIDSTLALLLHIVQKATISKRGKQLFSLSQDRLFRFLMFLPQDAMKTGFSQNYETLLFSNEIPQEWCSLELSYYKSSPSKDFSSASQPNSEGFSILKLPYNKVLGKPIEELLVKTLHDNQIPEQYSFDLLVSLMLRQNLYDINRRRLMIRIGLLALSNLVYAHSQAVQTRFLIADPEITTHLANLVSPDVDLPQNFKAVCFECFKAFFFKKSMIPSVLASLNVSVSYGLMMNLVRDFSKNLENPNFYYEREYVDSFYDFLQFMTSSPLGGNMACSAGLTSLLGYHLSVKTPQATYVVARSIVMLDHLIDGYSMAFPDFSESKGLDMLVDRVQYELEAGLQDIKSGKGNPEIVLNMDYAISYDRYFLLKNLLKFVLHLIQSGGSVVELRNLIDSSLISSLAFLLEHHEVYGSNLFASTTNIMSTFIHNEPTCYGIIHEKKLSHAFLDAVNRKILNSSDAITSIPLAFGAICLNSQGFDLFLEKNPIPQLFSIFTSLNHCKSLISSDNAAILGTYIDELMRHQPSLKDPIVKMIFKACDQVSALLDNFNPFQYINAKEYPYLLYLETFSSFLENIITNEGHARYLISKGIVSHVLNLIQHPVLAFGFIDSSAFNSFFVLLHHAVDFDAPEVFRPLLDCIITRCEEGITEFTIVSLKQATISLIKDSNMGHEDANNFLHFSIVGNLLTIFAELFSSHAALKKAGNLPLVQLFISPSRYAGIFDILCNIKSIATSLDIHICLGVSDDFVLCSDSLTTIVTDKDEKEKFETKKKELTQDSSFCKFQNIRSNFSQIAYGVSKFFTSLTRALGNTSVQDFNEYKMIHKLGSNIALVVDELINLSSKQITSHPQSLSIASLEASLIFVLGASSIIREDDSKVTLVLLISRLLGGCRTMDVLISLNETVSGFFRLSDRDPLSKSNRVLLALSSTLLNLILVFTSADFMSETSKTLNMALKSEFDMTDFNNSGSKLMHVLHARIFISVLHLWRSADDLHLPYITRALLTNVLSNCYQFEDGIKNVVDSINNLRTSIANGDIKEPLDVVTDDNTNSNFSLEETNASVTDMPESEKHENGIFQAYLLKEMPNDIVSQFEMLKSKQIELTVQMASYEGDLNQNLCDFLYTRDDVQMNADVQFSVTSGLIVEIKKLAQSTDCKAKNQLGPAVGLLSLFISHDFTQNKAKNCVLSELNFFLELLHSLNNGLPSDSHKTSIVCILYLLEVLLADSKKPDEFEFNSEDCSLKLTDGAITVDLASQKHIMSSVITLLSLNSANLGVVVSAFRVVVLLTSASEMIHTFVKLSGLPSLFKAMRACSGFCNESLHIPFISILRRLLEFDEVVELMMFDDLVNIFKLQGRARKTELHGFIRANAEMVLRSPECFIKILKDCCVLGHFTPESEHYYLELKESLPGVLQNGQTDLDPSKEQMSSVIVSFLLDELMDLTETRQFSDRSPNSEFTPENDSLYMYNVFLLQCLTELLSGYNACKRCFLNFQPRRKAPFFNLSRKYNSYLVGFFLEKLLPFGCIRLSENNEVRKAFSVSNWAISILVFLCAYSNEQQTQAVDEIRREVLTSVLKFYKSSSSFSENLEAYYCKLLVLAELCYRLCDAQTVSQKAPNHLLRRSQDQNVKTMIDLGYIPTLTNAISEIDMNYPVSRKVVRHILKPLQLLTKEAIFLSQTNPEALSGAAQDSMGDQSLSSSSEESSDSDREEPPDLYRNSVLGIFQGDIVNENDENYEDSEDDGVYEEMEFEDDQSGSADSVVSEDDADDVMYSDNDDMNIEFMVDEQDASSQNDDSSFDEASSHGDVISIDEEDLDNQGEEFEWEDEDNASSGYEDELDYNEDEVGENDSTTFEAMENAFTETSDNDDHLEEADHVSPVEIDFLENDENSSSEQDDEFQWEWNTETPSGADILSRHGALLRDLFPLPGLSRRVMIINSNDPSRSRPFLNNNASEGLLKHPLLLRNNLIHTPKATELWENLAEIDNHTASGAAFQRLLYYLALEIPNEDSSVLGWTSLKVSKHTDPLRATSDFIPLFSMQRWNSITSMFFAHASGSIALRITGSVLFALVPPALEKYNLENQKKEILENESKEEETRQPEVNIQPEEPINTSDMEGVTTEANEIGSYQEPSLINIRGREVDVSSLGIDPTFLLALPEEMREEVVFQHIQERHMESISDSSRRIDPSFLEVLPSDLRDELLFQEAVQMRLFDHATRNNNSVDHEVEMEEIDQGGTVSEHREKSVKPVKKIPVPNLLDRQGLYSLIRLIFISQHNGKNPYYDLIVNISENKQHRADIVGLLLYILQEASINDRASEKCYRDLTVKSLNNSQQKEVKKSTGLLESLCKVPVVNGISAPALILQQGIDLLSHLATWADHFASFFLSMHDFSGIASKKSAGRKSRESNVYKIAPINVLLGLLAREELFGNTLVMNTFSELLSTLTKPLLSFYKSEKLQKDSATTGYTNDQDSRGSTVPKQDPGTTASRKDKKILSPPNILDENLRLAASLITTDSCSSRTFQNALSVMFHLSSIPKAKILIGKELLRHGQEYGNSITNDLSRLCADVKSGKNESELQVALAPFCPASSNQAKLLRCLKALDYIFERRPKGQEQSPGNIIQLLEFYDNLKFSSLWEVLSECLSALRDHTSITHVSTVLLPLIESLMVICRLVFIELPEDVGKHISPILERFKTLFISFTEEHRKIINMMVFTTPSLMSGSFSLLVKNPKVLEFENKRNYFNRQLHEEAAKEQYPPLNITVRRDHVFLDSYRALHFKDADEVKFSKLNIHFRDEEGVDAGGVTREWLQVLARQMFNPDYALFLPVTGDATTFHPNRDSSVNPDHLSFFKFTGRIIGKALYDGRLLDCHFSRAVYKHMLHRSVSVKDIESLDPDYYKSLVWMLNNDITDIITEEFAVEKDVFGEKTVVDLIPNGRNIPVTELNKQNYVNRMVDYKLRESVKDQLKSLLDGFSDIIPSHLIQIFNEQELELLISGLPEIDIDDWKNNTEYHGYNVSSPQVQWFWRAVRSFDEEERAKLLQFATGTSKVPLNGFKELEGMSGFQRFNIHKSYGSLNRLPQSHTCFNQLDLPEYDTYEQLRSMLLTAINEGSEGFGFA